jgi:replicative DNA helicase
MTSLNNENAVPPVRRGNGKKAAASEASIADALRQIPPHSVEAEQAVLGGVFIKPEALNSLIGNLSPDDFYLPAHRDIYTAFLDLSTSSAPIDLATAAAHLKNHTKLESAGGAAYLAELMNSAISTANVEYFANMVREKSLARSLITSCSDIIGRCFDTTVPVNELLDESEQAVFAIANRTSGKTVRSAKELVTSVFEDLARRMDRNDMITGVPTKYTHLDMMTAGLQPSDLIIVAARPAMGKTAFVLNLAMRAAVWGNVPVVVYSLEMSMEQLMQRMLCAWGKVDLSRLRKNFLADSDWQSLHAAAGTLSAAPIFIDDTPALTPLELRARTRRLKAEHGIGMVVVDYLQLMRSARRVDSRELEISEISRSLKALAKELNVPVIALSQLNRKVEERSDKRPMLSDLRESGAIEQDADVIMFIYRDAAYLPKGVERPAMDEAEIIIGKQRNGPVGTVRLMYIPSYTAFEDIAPHGPSEGM